MSGTCRGVSGGTGGRSALELIKAVVTHSNGLLGGGCEGVAGRALCTEDVPAVSAVVLSDSDGEAFPTSHAVLHLMVF